VWRPITLRIEVSATCTTDPLTSTTSTTELAGSVIAYQITTVTLTGTLSRVMGLLLVDRGGDGADVDHFLPLDQGDDPVQSGAADSGQFAEAENDGALILVGDAKAGDDDGDCE